LDDKCPRLGGALAYYTAFSLAPLLLIAVAVAGLVFGREAAAGQLTAQFRDMVGEKGGTLVETMIAQSANPGSGMVATIVGTIMLLVGAIGVFGEVQDSLNTVWGVRPKEGRGWRGFLRDRFLSFSMVLGTAFLLLLSLVVSAVLAPLAGLLGQAAHLGVSFLVVTVLFAMIYRYLPDAIIAWRDVWLGAMVTSLLFSLGKLLIGLYLGRSAVASTFGAAGSLAALLIWLFYSAQIFLFGAELTRAFADRHGSGIIPAPHAELCRNPCDPASKPP
jgi:membrane protein